MARRASSSTKPAWLILAAVIALAALAGGYAIFGKINDPYRTITPLPVRDYLDNANSLRGNVYKLEAVVAKSLNWSPTAGRLFSVDVGNSADSDVLPVLIPTQFNHVNVERGQRFQFKIEVAEKGILRVQDVKKS